MALAWVIASIETSAPLCSKRFLSLLRAMSPIGRYIFLVVLVIVSVVRDKDRRLAVEHDVLHLTDQPPFHPFLHTPRVRPCHFNLEPQKQIHLQTP